jgi:hypothetical protein
VAARGAIRPDFRDDPDADPGPPPAACEGFEGEPDDCEGEPEGEPAGPVADWLDCPLVDGVLTEGVRTDGVPAWGVLTCGVDGSDGVLTCGVDGSAGVLT